MEQTINLDDSFQTFTPLEDLIQEKTKEKDDKETIEEPKVTGEEPVKDDEDATSITLDGDNKYKPLEALENEESEEPAYVTEEDEDEEPTYQEPVAEEQMTDYVAGMIELGLIQAPEEFEFDGSEEKLNELIDYHKGRQTEQVQTEFLNSINDPVLQSIIKFGLEDGKYGDLQNYISTHSATANLDSMDFSDDRVAENFVTQYYKNTTNLPDHKVQQLVEDDKDNRGLEDVAKEYAQNVKAQNAEYIGEMEKQAKVQRKAEQDYQANYKQNFMKSLKDTNYAATKQQEILNSFQYVQLQNGATMPEYQYKTQAIQSNPEHFIQFLDLLAGYDPKTGFTLPENKKRVEKDEQNETVFNKLKKRTAGGGRVGQQGNAYTPPRNPVDSRISKL